MKAVHDIRKAKALPNHKWLLRCGTKITVLFTQAFHANDLTCKKCIRNWNKERGTK